MGHKENNRQSPDYQNQGDPSNLAKIGIRSLVVEKKGRQFIFKWEAEPEMIGRVLKFYFPEISQKPQYISIEKYGKTIFTPEENISLDQLYTMNIKLQRKRGGREEIFFRETINLRVSDSFRFTSEEEKPAKSFPADMT
ncbi:MAG: hypothetical protein JRD93_00675 [Deltaproteobacteria bacterium]|nr:hypothetical protein [Deltaproteobacteria bacterium]